MLKIKGIEMGYFTATINRVSRQPQKNRKNTKKNNNTEHKIQDEIMKYLRKNGFVVVRINSSMLWTEEGNPVRSYLIFGLGVSYGFPDLLAMKGDKYFLFEVKTPKGKLSINQQKVKKFFEQHNVQYNIVRDISEVKRIIEE